MTDVLMIMMTH